MDILPGTGIGGIELGGSPDDLAAELGTPEAITPLTDTPGYPQGRTLIDYGDLTILTTPEDGIFAITIGRGFGDAELWGRRVFDLTGKEFTDLVLDETGLEAVWRDDADEDSSIEVSDFGLIVYLTDGEIDEVELYKPGWHPPDREEGKGQSW